MGTLNRHPADRLADVRSEIKRLETEEAELRAYLLEHPKDRAGQEHVAIVGSQSRKRVDLSAGCATHQLVPLGPSSIRIGQNPCRC
jgi:hypothetical protein